MLQVQEPLLDPRSEEDEETWPLGLSNSNLRLVRVLRMGRLLRVVRVIRVVRIFKASKVLYRC